MRMFGLAGLGDDVGGVLDPIEKIIRPVARIDRLDQQRDIFGRRDIGSTHEVADIDALGCRALLGRNFASQAMHGVSTDRRNIVERAGKQNLPILFAAGHGGQPELAIALAGRGIDPEHGELVARNRGLHRGGRHVIGELQLDRLETSAGRGVDALQQRALGEQVTQIGGKTGHGYLTSSPLRKHARTYSLAPSVPANATRKTHVRQHRLPHRRAARRRHRARR